MNLNWIRYTHLNGTSWQQTVTYFYIEKSTCYTLQLTCLYTKIQALHTDQLHKKKITFLSPIIVAYPGAKLTPLSRGNGIAP